MKIKYSYILLAMLMGLASCSKWLDVKPKTTVEDAELFSNEQGFQEALNGVYLKLVGTGMYGREMTFGLADAIAGQYELTAFVNLAYTQGLAGTNDGAVRTMTNNIWSQSYNAIANLNRIISAINAADSSLFSGKRYHTFKGEAYGLRAFLHFELVRWFSKSYVLGGAQDTVLPYKTLYSSQITPRDTVSAVLSKALNDLAIAEAELKSDDIYTGGSTAARRFRFNYYAVKATQARIYSWKGDQENALAAAQEVIAVAAKKFPFVAQSALTTSSETEKDRTFSTEHIFCLNMNELAENYVNLLDTSTGTSQLVVSSSRLTEQYEVNTVGNADWRYQYLKRVVSVSTGNLTFFGKLFQPSGYNAAYAKRMPLIRIPEMYYIAAEAVAPTNAEAAVTYLNTVRQNRGVTAKLETSLTTDQIQNEIRKEYWKEFPLEGQLWFYFKRTNAATIPGVSGTVLPSRYKMLLPELEIEYGL